MKKYLRHEFGSQKYFLMTAYYSVLQFLLPRFIPGGKLIEVRPNRIVFVCKGNICRSAFAHQYFLTLGCNNVASFGLCTRSGLSMDSGISHVAADFGVDGKVHRSTSIEEFESCVGDVYVCMEPSQVLDIQRELGNVTVVLLGNYLSFKRPYLSDPYATNQVYIRRSVELIKEAVDRLHGQLRGLD